MATELIMTKALGSLRPVDAAGAELLAKVANGATVKVTIRQARNAKAFRLYWALMGLLFDNQSRYASVEEVSDVLKCAVGHCTVIVKQDGTEIRIPKSISFGKMSGEEFGVFLDKIMDFAVAKIVPGVSKDDLRREIEIMAGERKAA